MLSHGLVSSALFLCVGVLYDRHKTRLVRYYGGSVSTMPNLSTISFSSTFFLLLQVTLQTRFTDRQHCLQHGYVQLLEARRVILHAIACLQLHKYINRGLQEAPTTRTHSRSRDSAGTRQSASPTRALLSSMITK